MVVLLNITTKNDVLYNLQVNVVLYLILGRKEGIVTVQSSLRFIFFSVLNNFLNCLSILHKNAGNSRNTKAFNSLANTHLHVVLT